MIQAVVAKTDVVEKLRSALRPSLDEYKVRKFKSDLDGNSASGLFLQIPYRDLDGNSVARLFLHIPYQTVQKTTLMLGRRFCQL